jgi:hypothetical protein
MLKTAVIAAVAGVGAFAAVLIGGRTSSSAAEEVRCRVDVEAFMADLNKLKPLDAEEIKKLLKPKP